MLLALVVLAAAPAPLSTVAEQSGWVRTGRYDEVVARCADFPRRYPGRVRCEPFGTTPLGRPMLALVASADGVLTAEAAARRGRPVVLLQGGIHAGEIDGKDAGFWLLRELLEGRAAPGALKGVTLVFLPVLNVDGHERVSPHNRPNQRGPREMGWRVTSQNLNLNRDYVKAEAPELAALLGLLGRWDPVLYADLHVTDGARFQHDVSVTFEPLVSGAPAMNAHGQALKEAVLAALAARGHRPLGFYPAFNADDDPASGFSAGSPPPRFSTAYWAARNRLAVLVETHSWKDYATRVRATFDACEALLTLAAGRGPAWRAAALAADAADARRAGEELPMTWQAGKASHPIEFLGYAYVREPSEVSGQSWVRYDETRPEVWTVPYFDQVEPAARVRAPLVGWLVPPPHAGWVGAKLALHGIAFRTLGAPVAGAHVRTFRAQATFRPGSTEGHQLPILSGEWRDDVQDLPRGTLLVPAAQARLRLAMHLLEPTLPDSLAAWGFFNAHLEQKEYLEDYVTEAFAREQLQDPAVKAEFEARLRDDAAFARDPAARLRFFARRHPSADARLGLLPVYQAGPGFSSP